MSGWGGIADIQRENYERRKRPTYPFNPDYHSSDTAPDIGREELPQEWQEYITHLEFTLDQYQKKAAQVARKSEA